MRRRLKAAFIGLSAMAGANLAIAAFFYAWGFSLGEMRNAASLLGIIIGPTIGAIAAGHAFKEESE